MRCLLLPVLLCFVMLPATPAAQTDTWPVTWPDTLAWHALPDALARAASSGWPVLVFVHAPWCGPCLRMERSTFADPAVRGLLARFERARLDFDDRETRLHVGDRRLSPFELARRLGAEATPALVVLAPDGTPLGHVAGYVEPEALLRALAPFRPGAP